MVLPEFIGPEMELVIYSGDTLEVSWYDYKLEVRVTRNDGTVQRVDVSHPQIQSLLVRGG